MNLFRHLLGRRHPAPDHILPALYEVRPYQPDPLVPTVYRVYRATWTLVGEYSTRAEAMTRVPAAGPIGAVGRGGDPC